MEHGQVERGGVPDPLSAVLCPTLLFPVAVSQAQPGQRDSETWLQNASFVTNPSIIDDKVNAEILTSRATWHNSAEGEGDPDVDKDVHNSYPLISEEENDGDVGRRTSDSNSDGADRKKSRKQKRKRKRKGNGHVSAASKTAVRSSAEVYSKRAKDYYLDTHGDGDNLVYGSLYRMDIPRYRSGNASKTSSLDIQRFCLFLKKSSLLNIDSDIDALDNHLKSGGRYWSAKYVAVEHRKNLKRLHFLTRNQPSISVDEDFVPLTDSLNPCNNASATVVEESWEDEILRRTREFNRLTQDHPNDEKIWLAFAEFQDKVASMQPQRAARLQTHEKKISILERAIEWNPGSEELLIHLLKSYQKKEGTNVLVDRWNKVLMKNSWSCKLWKEYLDVVRGEFSRFTVSDLRKCYSHAIQALSAACKKQCRQVALNLPMPSSGLKTLELELGLVDIFFSLCKFEWQAGYQEVATALLQAEIEFSLFCPTLSLSEHSKMRLFEHFWTSKGPRIGEEGAVGWSMWLEKEEEYRQKVVREQNFVDDEQGGWTGWSEPLPKIENIDGMDVSATKEVAEVVPESEMDIVVEEEDTEALLKQLGIDVDDDADPEIKDSRTWIKWCEEEVSRDRRHWMPRHSISGDHSIVDGDDVETYQGVVLFEDVCDFLFSLSSKEAQLTLVCHFIEFFGGEVSQWVSTNSSNWRNKFFSSDALPDLMMRSLQEVNDISEHQQKSCNGFCEEMLLGSVKEPSKSLEMTKFLRNAILLCLSEFPSNYVLEEAVLIAEQSSSPVNSSLAFRSLAKTLIKQNRQDVLLCGVYAKREANAGNMDHARRAFDMALLSVEGLSLEQRSDAALIYFWYAEAEHANNSGYSEEASSRLLHILSNLGTGSTYSPFLCKPPSPQILRAHQGFKDKIRLIRSTWARGAVDNQYIAFICSAALFEEMAAGGPAGIKVLEEALSMVLPERRINSGQLEFLYNYYVRMLLRHQKESGLPKIWEAIVKGLEMYPHNAELLKNLLDVCRLYTTPNKLRSLLDEFCRKKASITVWVFALTFEIVRGSPHRVHRLFERAFTEQEFQNSVILWRMYITYEVAIVRNLEAAKRVFFRAIHSCPWSKKLWLDGFLKLSSVLSAKELSDLQEVMRDKELNIRTDIYEILLQEDLMP